MKIYCKESFLYVGERDEKLPSVAKFENVKTYPVGVGKRENDCHLWSNVGTKVFCLAGAARTGCGRRSRRRRRRSGSPPSPRAASSTSGTTRGSSRLKGQSREMDIFQIFAKLMQIGLVIALMG